MQTDAERLNSLRLVVARVRDGRLERAMQTVQKQRERSQIRNRDRLFEQARQVVKSRKASEAIN